MSEVPGQGVDHYLFRWGIPQTPQLEQAVSWTLYLLSCAQLKMWWFLLFNFFKYTFDQIVA